MKRKLITSDSSIFLLIFSLAFLVRILNVGVDPLSNYESEWALQSWGAVSGEEFQITANPGYFVLTSLLFSLFDNSNALARFWPVLLGSIIVWVPYGLRRFLGREAAMIMGLGLALDPGLVAVSRIAGGPMMAFGFILISLVFIYRRKTLWAGIFGGMGLICGPSVFIGITSFLVAYWISRLLGIQPEWENLIGEKDTQELPTDYKKDIQLGLISAVVTMVLVGTLFTRFPAGLGAWGNSLAEFLKGWFQTPAVPVFQPFLAVVFYQPMAILFGLISVVRGWISGKERDRWLSCWLIAALSLTVVYSQRNVFDSVWALVPLWALASIELARFVKMPEQPVAAYGQAGLLFMMGVIFWLVSVSQGLGDLTWLVFLIIPLLAILTTIFVGLGWSWDAAGKGAVLGICLVLGIYSLSATFGPLKKGQNNVVGLWQPSPTTGQADLFRETLSALALIETGRGDWISIISLVDSPSLKWSLVDFTDVSYVTSIDSSTQPAIIITPEDGSDLSQTMSYRGQDFLWYNRPGWSGPLPQPLWPWITARVAPLETESIVMWARADLFPGETNQAEEDFEAEPLEGESENEDGSPQ